jgi:mono/diheme cytochrome c family protein
MAKTRTIAVALAMAGLAGIGLAGAASAEDEVERGRLLAKQHCSRCHVVDDANPFSGIASTPSFKLLVTALADWRDRFETFHTRRPHPSVVRFEGIAPPGDGLPTMKTVDMKLEDIDAIVAFASWLKQQQ